MIIWLNGTFGAGKTTTSKELAAMVPNARIFDSEQVGYMLRHVLESVPVKDFQDWRPWRALVVETATQILGYVGGVLVVPQSVLVEQYWTELSAGFAAAGIPVRHFVLHTDQDTLTRRIESDTVETGARQWRLDHLTAYESARPWLSRTAETIDTTNLPPDRVAHAIASAVQPQIPCDAPRPSA
ncbi:ATP-binding protein [Streptomyces sp. So13.3]|uniref:AAA family ATPase n=1 Tax=Streptomyces TaxID=1883 RepID=UPI0011070741|nr:MULTISPECIES: AAA family ATPase [Streptomyces]MCZ4100488.1 AAA family ATPase [Streptomyces sp. H39-C1]QNA76106.1 ATP-binding protein [Streptomyces sp. So13.3]